MLLFRKMLLPLKILFVQPYFDFLEVFYNTLPRYLAERGHIIKVVSHIRDKQKANASLREKNICFYFLDALSFSFPILIREFPCFLSFEDIVKQIRPDIIHVNNLPFLTSLQSINVARRMSIPSILHVHGVIGMRSKILDIAQYAFIRTVMRKAFYNATRVICLTKSDALEVQRLGCPYEKIRIIPNGVDVEKFKPHDKIIDNMIFWCGRFIPEKGLEYLIRALALVVKEKPQVKLIMAGNGPLFPKILSLVKHYKLEKNVIFKGYVVHDKLPNLFGTSSLYVLPSLKEGMPYALLEAMACGKAVIGSDIPGISEVITHGINGVLVPPKDPKALAEAITRLLEDRSLRRRLGENARKMMVEKYSWQKISEKIEGIYYEAITSCLQQNLLKLKLWKMP